jgi:hypothetical protein
MAGGFLDDRTYAIAARDGLYLSEFSVHFMLLFALSSLVRYRPEVWAHAISRTALPGRPPDDQAIAIIEQFLDMHATIAPRFIVTALNPTADPYRTPA